MSKEHSHSSRDLEQRAKQLFDASVEDLDGHTRSRLAQARHRALDGARKPRPASWLWGMRALVPAGAAALAIATVLIVWQGPAQAPVSPELAALQDLEILMGEEELEMIEDLEFYTWLDELPEFSAPPAEDDSVG